MSIFFVKNKESSTQDGSFTSKSDLRTCSTKVRTTQHNKLMLTNAGLGYFNKLLTHTQVWVVSYTIS